MTRTPHPGPLLSEVLPPRPAGTQPRETMPRRVRDRTARRPRQSSLAHTSAPASSGDIILGAVAVNGGQPDQGDECAEAGLSVLASRHGKTHGGRGRVRAASRDGPMTIRMTQAAWARGLSQTQPHPAHNCDPAAALTTSQHRPSALLATCRGKLNLTLLRAAAFSRLDRRVDR